MAFNRVKLSVLEFEKSQHLYTKKVDTWLLNSWISLFFLYSVDRTLLLGKIRRDTINQLLIYGAPKHFWSGAYLCHFSNRRWNLHGKWVDGFKLDLTVEKAPSNLEVANGTSLISWSNNCQLQSFDNNIILRIKGQQNARKHNISSPIFWHVGDLKFHRFGSLFFVRHLLSTIQNLLKKKNSI